MRPVHLRFAFLLTIAFFFAGCGGGTSRRFEVFQKPADIKASTTDITYDGRLTRFAYVANSEGGTIAAVDQDREEIADSDRSDDYDDTPVAVGGYPTALAIQEKTPGPRIFVGDSLNQQLLAFDAIPPADPTKKELKHAPFSLGGSKVARASKPIFRDRGRRSNPSLSGVSVDVSVAVNESWELKYEGDSKGYRVSGSVSGLQINRAFEDQLYTSDNGSISFTVRSGGERTTSNDRFRFGTVILEPLDLGASPVDLVLNGTILFITTVDPATVVVFDTDSLSIATTVALDDGSGTPAISGKSIVVGNELFVPNLAGTNVFRVNVTDYSLSWTDTGIQARTAAKDGQNDVLYLLPIGTKEISIWEIATESVVSTIRLSDYGYSFEPFVFEGSLFGLVPTSAGGIDVLDLAQRTRIDTRDGGSDPESDTLNEEFFDVPPKSSPQLVAVNTIDGVTRTEYWQLIYEGVIPDTRGLDATPSGDTISAADGLFQTWGIQVGDRCILDIHGSREEIEVAEVIDETQIRLVSAPSIQTATTMEIRPNGAYLVIGSISGPQLKRAVEGESYISDDASISLTIRPSRTQPTTRGDFFSFLTSEGIDPIRTSGKRLAKSIAVFTRPGKSEPTAYAVQQATNVLSVLNLDSLRERKTIR